MSILKLTFQSAIFCGLLLLAGCGHGPHPSETLGTDANCYLSARIAPGDPEWNDVLIAPQESTSHGNERVVPCGNRPKLGDPTFGMDAKRYFGHEPWFERNAAAGASASPRPKIGIAFAGGGTKAAPFGVGILKRLVEEGWIHDVDLISSVSGGSYSSLFLYTRAKAAAMLAAHKLNKREGNCANDRRPEARKTNIYFPCLFVDYRAQGFFYNKHLPGEPEGGATYNCAKDREGTLNPRDYPCYHALSVDLLAAKGSKKPPPRETDPEQDDLVLNLFGWGPNYKIKKLEQYYCNVYFNRILRSKGAPGEHNSLQRMRCYPDIMGYGRGNEITTTGKGLVSDKARDYSWGFPQFLLLAPTIPINIAANWVFDWGIESSPSGFQQRIGILRSFGDIPYFAIDPSGDYESEGLSLSTELTYRDLECFALSDRQRKAQEYLDCLSLGNDPLPLWILNTSTPIDPSFDFTPIDLRRMDEGRFEIAPTGFGGHRYGFVRGESPDKAYLALADAMAASHAFADPRQRVKTYLGNLALFAAMETLNIKWSVEVPNYTMPMEERILKKAMPFPLYLANHIDENRNRPIVHLGDGGVARDNFGLIPLIERNTEKIILVDQSNDGLIVDGHALSPLTNLCEIEQYLSSRNLTIKFEGAPAPSYSDGARVEDNDAPFLLNDNCNKMDRGPTLKRWVSYLEWKSPVWHGEVVDVDDLNPPESGRIEIFFVKAALNAEAFGLNQPKNFTNRWPRVIDNAACIEEVKAALDWTPQQINTYLSRVRDPLADDTVAPLTLCGWYHRNLAAGYALFPQHGVEVTTANSSPQLMMAYVDLGWYLAGALKTVFEFSDEGGADGASKGGRVIPARQGLE